MANVPRVTRQVFTEALPNVRRTAAETEESAGVGIARAKAAQGQAMAGFGHTIGQVSGVFADIAIKEREKADQTALLEFDRQVSQWEAQTIYDPENGALAKKGKAAMGVPEAVLDDFHKQTDALVANLQPGRQQEAARKLLLRREMNLDVTLRRHTFQEMQQYQVGELKATVNSRVNLAIAAAGNPDQVKEHLEFAIGALKDQGAKLGMTPAQLDDQVMAIKSQAYEGVIMTLQAQEKDTLARAYFQEVKGDIKGEALARVTKAIEIGSIREQSQDAAAEIIAANPDDISAQIKAAEKLEDRKVRDETVQRLEHAWSRKKAIENEEHRQWTVEARNVLDKTGDWTALEKLPFWTRLEPSEVASLKSYATHVTDKQPVKSDQGELYRLYQLATSDDPKKRAEFYDPKRTNMMALVDKLSAQDWEQLMKLQTVGTAGLSKEQHALLVNQSNQNRMVDEAIVAMGFDPRPPDPGTKTFDAGRVEFVNNFRREVRDQVAALEASRADKGSLATATDAEVQAIVDRLRTPMGKSSTRVAVDRYWFNPRGDEMADRFAWEIKTFEDIPLQEREAIKRELYKRGKPVSKEAVLGYFRNYLAGIR